MSVESHQPSDMACASLMEKGDALFVVSEDYTLAVESYSHALDALVSGGSASAEMQCCLLLRRSAANLRCGNTRDALQDAEDAAELQPGDVNVYLRRGYGQTYTQRHQCQRDCDAVVNECHAPHF